MKSWESLRAKKEDNIHERLLQVLHTNDYGSNNPASEITKPKHAPILH